MTFCHLSLRQDDREKVVIRQHIYLSFFTLFWYMEEKLSQIKTEKDYGKCVTSTRVSTGTEINRRDTTN